MNVKKAKRCKTGRNRNIDVDRISELSESIIHDQILYRLSRRDRAQTSALSKTWYHLYKTYPALDIDFDCFYRSFLKENPEFRSYSPEFIKSLKTFRKRVGKSLGRFRRKKLRLHSLRVKNVCHSYPKLESDLNKWIGLALQSRMEKLKLYCPNSSLSQKYPLPKSIYFCTTLTTLNLNSCVLDQPLSVFTSLKKLTLSRCRLEEGPLVLNHSDCPALEYLSLFNCLGLDSICISNLVQLSRVELEYHGPLVVEIASKSVQKISIVDFSYQRLWKISIYGCIFLTSLYLNTDTFIDNELHSLLTKLPLLEQLCVYCCYQLKAMKVSNPRLETLVVGLSVCSSLTSIDIEVPTLKNLMFLLPSSSSLSTEHTKIKVHTGCLGSLETLVLCSANMRDEEFHELISQFPQLQSLWIFGCHRLQRIKIPNLQLRRLYIARCSELKSIKVGRHKLLEMYCRGREDLKISVPDLDRMYSTGSLKLDRMGACTRRFWSPSLHEMLMSVVQDKHIADLIGHDCGFFNC